MFRKLDMFPSSSEGRATPLLGTLERANLRKPETYVILKITRDFHHSTFIPLLLMQTTVIGQFTEVSNKFSA
jgi:hypothetical protein